MASHLMAALRPATAAETVALWPAVRATRIFATVEELLAFREAGRWRVRVTPAGESLILAPWRARGDRLAIKGLWAAPGRVPALVEDAVSVACTQGFARVLTPLLTQKAFADYERAGMRSCEHIVALQGFASDLAGTGGEKDSRGFSIRCAAETDFAQLEALDSECFDEFWHYGAEEIVESHRKERIIVASDASRGLLGYATCSLHGASATVGRLAVAPASRRKGVASALLADAAEWAARQEAFALTLCTQESNEASRRLYAQAGLFELNEPYVIGVRGV